jgi:hypothetical protein
MKKIMGTMLGLSLLMGTVALFADEAPKKEATSTTKTKKTKKAKTKKTDTTSTEKKS